jgi:hypothetical protein
MKQIAFLFGSGLGAVIISALTVSLFALMMPLAMAEVVVSRRRR